VWECLEIINNIFDLRFEDGSCFISNLFYFIVSGNVDSFLGFNNFLSILYEVLIGNLLLVYNIFELLNNPCWVSELKLAPSVGMCDFPVFNCVLSSSLGKFVVVLFLHNG